MARHTPNRILGRMIADHEATRNNAANVTQIVHHAKVINIDDPINSKRIKARIDGVDDALVDGNLPWCVSLTPNFFYWVPQVGEYVAIIMVNPWNKNWSRFYFGPIQSGNFGEQSYSDVVKQFGFPNSGGD